MIDIREEWRDFPLNDNYMVSTYGQVLSKRRSGSKGGLLKPRITKRGYVKHMISMPTKQGYIVKNYKGHTLVLITFDRQPLKGECCNHKDGNKLNNHISNLEWCTNADNMRHAVKTGIIAKRKLLTRKVTMISSTGKELKTFASIKEAAAKTGTSPGGISNAINGRCISSGGFIWRTA